MNYADIIAVLEWEDKCEKERTMSIKDKMKNAKESHLFGELSQEEKIEAIVNGKLKCRMIEELEKIKKKMEVIHNRYAINFQGFSMSVAQECIDIIDNEIAELKGENNE